jgi:hypothetical protein
MAQDYFVFKSQLKERLKINGLMDMLSLVIKEDATISHCRLLFAIWVYLSKYYEIHLNYVDSPIGKLLSGRTTYIKGFTPAFSLEDVISFLVEHKLIEKQKRDLNSLTKYKVL